MDVRPRNLLSSVLGEAAISGGTRMKPSTGSRKSLHGFNKTEIHEMLSPFDVTRTTILGPPSEISSEKIVVSFELPERATDAPPNP